MRSPVLRSRNAKGRTAVTVAALVAVTAITGGIASASAGHPYRHVRAAHSPGTAHAARIVWLAHPTPVTIQGAHGVPVDPSTAAGQTLEQLNSSSGS